MNIKSLSLISGFTSMGILAGFSGPLIQASAQEKITTYTQNGHILTAQFGGCLAGILLAMFFSKLINKKPIIITGSIIGVSGFMLGFLGNNYFSFIFLCLLTGICLGIYEAGYNSFCLDYISHLNKKDKNKTTNIYHFFFGIGAILAPFIFETQYNKTGVIGNALPAFIFFIIISFIMILISPEIIPVSSPKNRLSRPKSYKILLFLVSAITLYAGMESSMFGWIALYWSKNISGLNSFTPGHAASLFWIFFSLGRIALGGHISKIGESRYVIAASLLIIIITIIWGFNPAKTLIVFLSIIIIGILFSALFPTIILMADRTIPGKSILISGLFTLFATISAAIFPQIVSSFSAKKNLSVLPWIISITATIFFIILLITTIIIRNLQNHSMLHKGEKNVI